MNCYIVSPKDNYILPPGLDKENTLFFPESRMTSNDLFYTTRPKDFHIITDSPFLVSLYDRKEVFIYNHKSKKWYNPVIQTYGTSYSLIISEIWNYESSIPQAVIDTRKTTNVMGFNKKDR